MEQSGFRILYEGTKITIEEKKSKFIGITKQIQTSEQAEEFLAQIKKEYWDARHHCYAYVLGERNEIMKCSDDGEPAQTAGKPILDTIINQNIHNMILIVVRYFGGTLLGTGGLVRAYQKAASEALKESVILTLQTGRKIRIQTDYTYVGKIQYLLAEEECSILDTIYEADVTFLAVVPDKNPKNLQEQLLNQTNGSVLFKPEEEVMYAILKNEIKIF